jgi:hypothetical protein
VNDNRNAMTNAERQRRYRERKRGGAPVGRWRHGSFVATFAKVNNIGRTVIFMAGWIREYAPDVAFLLESGAVKVTPTYKRLTAEYDREVWVAIQAAEAEGSDPRLLTCRRENGAFVVE